MGMPDPCGSLRRNLKFFGRQGFWWKEDDFLGGNLQGFETLWGFIHCVEGKFNHIQQHTSIPVEWLLLLARLGSRFNSKSALKLLFFAS